MALHNGAQAYLVKQLTSADALDKAIQKAVTSVASKLNERPPKGLWLNFGRAIVSDRF